MTCRDEDTGNYNEKDIDIDDWPFGEEPRTSKLFAKLQKHRFQRREVPQSRRLLVQPYCTGLDSYQYYGPTFLDIAVLSDTLMRLTINPFPVMINAS